MLIALTRPISPTLEQCELTHLAREPIDLARAIAQHATYEQLLTSLGATVARVAAAPEYPDAVFIEDTAIVLDEIAIVTHPGAPSRRGETEAVAEALAQYRPVVAIEAPATLDGGDVLQVGPTLYVGRGGRSNQQGVDQLATLVKPLGYVVVAVDFSGCLHLKSAVSVVAEDVLLINPAWVSAAVFEGCDTIPIDDREPMAANALRIGDAVIYPSQFPRTLELLRQRGLRIAPIDYYELGKAEGGVTCCSLLFEDSGRA
jgi:dimethylargininase